MSVSSAQSAISTSALVVGGIYLYRKLVEGPAIVPSKTGKSGAAQLIGIGPVPPVGKFVVGWGFTFLVLSLIAESSPELAKNTAFLIVLGDVLANGSTLFADINKMLSVKNGGDSNTISPPNATITVGNQAVPAYLAPLSINATYLANLPRKK